MQYFNEIGYLWMIIFIMISAGIAKDNRFFDPLYHYIKKVFKSNRSVLVIISAIGGMLPIHGRVTVSAGLIDTMAHKDGPRRQKMGIVDYLATHHYYMWSPIEKTVILPMAAMGITYTAWVQMIWPFLAGSFLFIGWYIYTQVEEQDIVITETLGDIGNVFKYIIPMFLSIVNYILTDNYYLSFGALALYYMVMSKTWKVIHYINWQVIFIVGVVIVLSNYLKSNEEYYQSLIIGSTIDPSTLVGMSIITCIGFLSSFIMGSSGKFIAFAILLSQIFGSEYFLWFFAVDYVGYLISPSHKCLLIGNRYFGTPFLTYYRVLGLWSFVLLLVGFFLTF